MQTVVINFNKSATELEISEIFSKYNLQGVKTSSLTKKYAVDLPNIKIINSLKKESLVDHVFD